jgi:hypothetical protein
VISCIIPIHSLSVGRVLLIRPVSIVLLIIAFPASLIAQSLQPDWFTIIKGPQIESKPVIAPDNHGNVFVSGSLSLYEDYFHQEDGFIDSIEIKRYNQLNTTAYFTKLDNHGKVLFYKLLTVEGFGEAKDMKIDSKGNVYVVYYFLGTMDLDGEMISSLAGGIGFHPNAVLVKFSPDGNVLWNSPIISGSEIMPLKLNIDQNDEVVLMGEMNFNGYHNEVSVSGSVFLFDNSNAFFIKFDSGGTIIWLHKIFYYKPGVGYSFNSYRSVTDFRIHNDGSIYLCGYITETAHFSHYDSAYYPYPASLIFLVKYSPDREVSWVRTISNPNITAVSGITVIYASVVSQAMFLRNGNIGIIGLHHDVDTPFMVGDKTITEYNFGVEFSTEGVLTDVYDFYTANSVVLGFAADDHENLYFLGGLSPGQIFQYSGFTYQSYDEKFFIIKYNHKTIEWAQFHGNAGLGVDLKLDNDGNMYWVGAWACTVEIFGRSFAALNCFNMKSDVLISRLSSKSIEVDISGICPNEPFTFDLRYFDFVYASDLEHLECTIEGSKYESTSFTHTFATGGTKNMLVVLSDNLGRQYTRVFNIEVQQFNIEISQNNNVIRASISEGIDEYKWFRGEELIQSGTVPYLFIDKSGVYKLQIVTEEGCLFISNELVVEIEDPITSTADTPFNEIALWPNPAQNFLNIEPGNNLVDISIFSTNGKILLNYSISQRTSMDISILQPGMYFIKTTSGGKSHHFKLIKN